MAKRQVADREIGKVKEYAERRAGAMYHDACTAARQRLEDLCSEFDQVPASYKGFLAVGICTAIESHLKYSFARSAERFAPYPDLLSGLFSDIAIDIRTLISVNSRMFGLSDVVAAAISVSSLKDYKQLANRFFKVLSGAQEYDFPYTYQEIFTETNSQYKKEIAQRLRRIDSIFQLRHRYVHETSISEVTLDEDLLICGATDAIWLIDQFEEVYNSLELDPAFGVKEEPVVSAQQVDLVNSQIDARFERLKEICGPQSLGKCEAFKKSLKKYLMDRAIFQASHFAFLQSEEAMSYYVSAAPEYLELINRLYLERKFLQLKFPYGKQLADAGIELETE